MGIYLNKGNAGFTKYTISEYVDKTEMIAYINSTLGGANMLTCVTRPRRFGKSLAANMLCAYYDKSCDSSALFDKFEIARDASYREHLNKYNVIYVDITNFIGDYQGDESIVKYIQTEIKDDLVETFPDVIIKEGDVLMKALMKVVKQTGTKFICIIDEWDALCRELSDKPNFMDDYVKMLRRLFKSNDTPEVFAGVYMTGILPIKKYGTQSALNDFREYSMTSPGPMGGFLGFNDEDVKALAEEHNMDFSELKRWYDGYEMTTFDWRDPKAKPEKIAIYNPNSVMTAIRNHHCDNYWAKSEAFESLQRYIDYDFNGVKETLERLLSGEPVRMNVLRFGNDLYDVGNNEELFTLLVHLGYLSYDRDNRVAFLPNQEIREEFVEALRGSKSHKELSELVRASDKLIEAVWMRDEDAVAKGVEYIHNHKVAPNFYNNEQSLRSVVRTAFLGAIDHYIEIQELTSGKGYADLVFIPRRNTNHPLLVIELKWNDTPDAAITQIKNRDYPEILKPLAGEVLLVGINYDSKTKEHSCIIESITKD